MKEININIIEKGADGDLVVKYPTTTEKQVKGLKESLDKKVDKVDGKQLSTNDYTTVEKNKLSNLNNYDDTSIKADIAKKADTSTVNTNLSKKVDKVTGKQLSTNDYTTAEKAEVAKVKNKADTTYVNNGLNNKADKTDLDLKIDKTSITSDLAGTDESKVLSQKAGNFLEDAVKKIDLSGKIDKSSITNSYTGTSISNVLSQKGANDLFKALNSSGDDISFSKNNYFHMLKINNKYCILTVLQPKIIGITDAPIIPYGFRPKSTINTYLSGTNRLTIDTNGKLEGEAEYNVNVFSITYDC